MEGKQEEAFNDKKNLNLDYITTKFNLKGEPEETKDYIANSIIAQKPNITKRELLTKIDEILNNKGDASSDICDKITEALRLSKKKIFKIKHRTMRCSSYNLHSENDNSNCEKEEVEELEDIEEDEKDLESIQELIKKGDNNNSDSMIKINGHIQLNNSEIHETNTIKDGLDNGISNNNNNNDSNIQIVRKLNENSSQ